MPSNYTYEFGHRLKSARELQGLSPKDVASELHLSEKVIEQLESQEAIQLPAIFLRGYIRSYAKILKIDEQEVQKVLNQITESPSPVAVATLRQTQSRPSGPRYIKTFFYFVITIWIGCTAIWWGVHSGASFSSAAIAGAISSTKAIIQKQTTLVTQSSPAADEPLPVTTTTMNEPPITPVLTPVPEPDQTTLTPESIRLTEASAAPKETPTPTTATPATQTNHPISELKMAQSEPELETEEHFSPEE